MRIPDFATRWLLKRLQRNMRRPLKLIKRAGLDGVDQTLISRKSVFDGLGVSVRLHDIIRSDPPDSGLHDHPWWSISIILKNSYYEVMPGGLVVLREPGDIVFRRATALHRVFLPRRAPCVSLFIHGRRSRRWGFQKPDGTWVEAPNQGN
jgi:hypothetical protein